MPKMQPATIPHYVILYDTPGGAEEYYAYFASEKDALDRYQNTFGGMAGYKLVGIAKMVSYPEQNE